MKNTFTQKGTTIRVDRRHNRQRQRNEKKEEKINIDAYETNMSNFRAFATQLFSIVSLSSSPSPPLSSLSFCFDPIYRYIVVC